MIDNRKTELTNETLEQVNGGRILTYEDLGFEPTLAVFYYADAVGQCALQYKKNLKVFYFNSLEDAIRWYHEHEAEMLPDLDID